MPTSKKYWTTQDDQLIRNMADRGATIARIATRLRRTMGATKNRAKFLNVIISKPTRLSLQDRTNFTNPDGIRPMSERKPTNAEVG